MLMDIIHFKWHELALFNLLTNKLLLNNFSNLLKNVYTNRAEDVAEQVWI